MGCKNNGPWDEFSKTGKINGRWKMKSQKEIYEKIFEKILSLRQVFSNCSSQAKNNFGKNTVAEPSFDWNLIFLRKTKKKKNNT